MYWYQIFTLDSAVVEVKEMFSSHGSLLTIVLYFCPYSNQVPVKKGVFLFFALILSHALPKRVFFRIFALTLTEALPQRVSYSIFTLILT